MAPATGRPNKKIFFIGALSGTLNNPKHIFNMFGIGPPPAPFLSK